MGEVADMMIDGTLCEGCGVYMEGEAQGFPRRCVDCQVIEIQKTGGLLPAKGKVPCPQCGRNVRASGLKDHQRDVHQSGDGHGR